MLNKLALSAVVVLAGLGSGIVAEPARSTTLIDTTPDWNRSSRIMAFGEPNTATYGQTFTVPNTDNVLNSFSFILGVSLIGTSPVTFAGYVAQWDGSKATGSILYSSKTRTYDGNGFQTFSFNTGGISLTSGQKYVAFLSASNFFDGGTHTTGMAFTYNDVYAGGDFVFFNNGNDFTALTSNNWGCADDCGYGDTAFTASFSPASQQVPEPSALMGLLGLGALSALSGKRRGKE